MRYFFLVIALSCLSGCVSNSSPTAMSAQSGHAECLVCKKAVDLACVDVKVDDKTPSAVYQGKTYYFCSDDCRDLFEKDPQKYLAQK